MSQTFTCALCGGTFPMGDDDEAQTELKANFGDASPADCEMVCDGCYERVKP